MKFMLPGMAAIALLLTGCHFNAGLNIPDGKRKYSQNYVESYSSNDNQYVGLFRDDK